MSYGEARPPLSNLMQRALDDLALEAMVEIDKVFAVARDADNKIPVFVWMYLRI